MTHSTLDDRFPNGVSITYIRHPQYPKLVTHRESRTTLGLDCEGNKLLYPVYLTNGVPSWELDSAERIPKGLRSLCASNMGGFTVAWTIEKRSVKCAVAMCNVRDNFNKGAGRQIAKTFLLKSLTSPSTTRQIFSFLLPDDVCVHNRNGVSFVRENEFPFMEYLRQEFCDWLSENLEYRNIPKVYYERGKPQLLYFVKKLERLEDA